MQVSRVRDQPELHSETLSQRQNKKVKSGVKQNVVLITEHFQATVPGPTVSGKGEA